MPQPDLTPRQQYVQCIQLMETQLQLLQHIHRHLAPLEGIENFHASSLDLCAHISETLERLRMIDRRIGIDDDFAETLLPDLLHNLSAVNDTLEAIRSGAAGEEK